MAKGLSPFQKGVTLLSTMVNRSLEVDAQKQARADKLAEQQMMFGKIAYESAMNRWNKKMSLVDELETYGAAAAAQKLAEHYNFADDAEKADWTMQVTNKIREDKNFLPSVIKSMRLPQPNMKDYMPGTQYNKIVNERINQENAINVLLFGSRKGPSAKTTRQLKAMEQEALTKMPSMDEQIKGVGLGSLDLSGIKTGERAPDFSKMGKLGELAKWAYSIKRMPLQEAISWAEEQAPNAEKYQTVKLRFKRTDGSEYEEAWSAKKDENGIWSVGEKFDPSKKKDGAPTDGTIETKPRAASPPPSDLEIKDATTSIRSAADSGKYPLLKQLYDAVMGGDEDAGTPMTSLRRDLVNRVRTLQEDPKYRGRETGDLYGVAIEQLYSGLTIKDNYLKYIPFVAEDVQYQKPESTTNNNVIRKNIEIDPNTKLPVPKTIEQYNLLESGEFYIDPLTHQRYMKP